MSNTLSLLAARILLVGIFLLSGVGMLSAPAATAGYFAGLGLPAAGLVVWLVIALKFGASIALLLGFKTRYAAWALAAFSIGAALLGHLSFGDPEAMIQFAKDFSIAGGLLALSVTGAGAWSLDAWHRDMNTKG